MEKKLLKETIFNVKRKTIRFFGTVLKYLLNQIYIYI